jgi:hypothetical protein
MYLAFKTLNTKLNRVLTLLGDEVMPALDDLNEAVNKLEVSADAIVAKVEQLIVQGTVDPAAAQAVIDRINAVGAKLDAVAV